MGVIFGSVENMSGSGSGDGDGSGYGYGYGSGYGYGYEYGYGSSKEYLQAVADSAAGDKLPKLKADGAVLAFWRSDKDGRPCNNGYGPARHIGMVEEEDGTRGPCQAGMLHATMSPSQWKGERLWVVALYPPVTEVNEDKLASKKREIIAEIVPNFYA